MFQLLKYPIIQAPMAGGISTVSLAKAVSQNGGLGFLAAGYASIKGLEKDILAMQQDNLLFGINVFVPSEEMINNDELIAYKSRLERDWGLNINDVTVTDDGWNQKLNLLQKYKVPFVSFTFGCPTKQIIEALQRCGSKIIVTVTDLQEAKIAQLSGADIICLQGLEAGGHRASFKNVDPSHNKPLLELLMEVKEHIHIPIIVAGGIMHGSQIKQYIQTGAAAVQLGTAFICCDESGANKIYKEALGKKKFKNTTLTRAFSGRLARGLENDFIRQYNDVAPSAYPAVHYMTQMIRKNAVDSENPQAMSLWAGKGFEFARELSVKELINQLAKEADFI